jgi:hypothetical protein
MQAQMLAPAAVLVLWTLIVLFWVLITRNAAFGKMGITLSNLPVGGRYQDRESEMPDRVSWKSHNYTHLVEQPTIFYAAAVIIAIMGAGGIDVLLAWAYVGLRIVHSLWQGLVNTIPVRVALFMLSTTALAVLAIRAVMATLLADPSALPV